jgi:hypothetical protein
MTAPLTSPEMDMRSLDGFLLNVERLLASELWALTKNCPEAFRAATGLWCRSWKQIPACSLPANESILAAFADLPLAKFRKHRDLIMRGFELCDDGRYYHRTLSEEANRVWPSIQKSRRDREADKERLRQWRERQKTVGGNVNETASETPDETRTKRRTSRVEEKGSNTEGIEEDTSSLRSDVCAEPPSRSAPEPKSASNSPAFIALETNKRGEMFIVSEAQVHEFQELYPAVNVEQQLRAMRGWLMASPGRRKTKSGMLRFINSWLAKDQNRGHSNVANGSKINGKRNAHQDHLEGLRRLIGEDDERSEAVSEPEHEGQLALSDASDGRRSRIAHGLG